MPIEFTVLISLMGTILGGVLGYVGMRRNQTNDTKAEAKSDGIILTEIGYVKSGIDDIKRKQEHQDRQHAQLCERMAKVEGSAAQAHKRIDRLEGKK